MRGVKFHTAVAQQAAIGGVADERVFEEISGVRRGTARKDEAGFSEPAERVQKLGLAALGHRRQQLVGEFTADDGGGLGDFLGRLAETIEPRHQQRMQRRGDGHRRRHDARERRLDLGWATARFEHRPCQLLDEQGHAVGPLDDLAGRFAR